MSVPSIPLGAFELHAPIRKGGMGEVWRGMHTRSGIPAALKVMTGERARQRRYREAFRNEVRAVASLEHPGIVMVFDYGLVTDEAEMLSGGRLVAGSPYLVMELASRGSLDQVRGVFAWRDIKGILMSLLDALAHAHARNVIHRDIKPGNVLLASDSDQRPGIKLTDFGLAQALDEDETGSSSRAGTPRYMAPELFEGHWRDYGPWSDLYALGCLAYELSSRRPIFDGTTYQDLKRQHLYEPPIPLRPLQEVPRGFDQWIARLTMKRPHERFACAADAAWSLLRLEDGHLVGSMGTAYTTGEGGGDETSMLTQMTGFGATSTFFFPSEPDAEQAEQVARELRIADAETYLFDGGVGEANTFLFPDESPSGSGTRRIVDLNTEQMTPIDRGLPPMPITWRPPWTDDRSIQLVDAGLALFNLRRMRLVGREDELDMIWNQLVDVRKTSSTRVVHIDGGAGVGKSQLAEWIAERAHELGAGTVFRATHAQISGPANGLPRMVSRYLSSVGLTRAEVRRRTRRLLQEQFVNDDYEWDALTELMMAPVAEKRVARAKPIRFSSPNERYVLLFRLLERAARMRPAIVILEDVQWGSDALWFVQYLMARQTDTPIPVLVLMTSRTDSLKERPLESFITGQLEQLEGVNKLHLEPLQGAQRAELVNELLCLCGDLAARVTEATQGNPLFAVELVGDWVDRGLLQVGEDGFILVGQAELPHDVHDIWLARVDRALEGQDPTQRLAVEIAAVLGQDVDVDDWAVSCEKAGINLSWSLGLSLISANLAKPGESVWTFSHGMLRDSLERAAKEAGRWEDHNRACASMLLERYGTSRVGIAERVGRHLLEAGDRVSALGLLLQGAQERIDSNEFRYARELLDLWEQAMYVETDDFDDPRWGLGWLLRYDILKLEGKYQAAANLAQQTVNFATDHNWDAVLPRALRVVGDIKAVRGELSDATEAYEKAMHIYAANKKYRGLRDCLKGQGEVSLSRGMLSDATVLLRRALVISQKLGDKPAVADCLIAVGRVLEQRGEYDLAFDMVEQALALYEKSGNRLGVATCFEIEGRIRTTEGELKKAEASYRRALTICQQLGARQGIASCYHGLANVARQSGRHSEAEEGYRQAIDLLEGLGGADRVLSLLNLGVVLLADARYDDARTTLESAREIAMNEGRRALLACAHINLLACDAHRGDWFRWRIHYQRGVRLLDETGYVSSDIAWPAQLAGIIAAGAGKNKAARQALDTSLAQWRSLGREDKVAELEALVARL